MTRQIFTAAAAAIALAFGSASFAQAMTKEAYKSSKDKISADYKAAKDACKSQMKNAKDICMEDAKGKEKIAKAELEAQFKPSAKNSRKAAEAKAEAEYSVAKEKCDDMSGKNKSDCKKDAKVMHDRAKADAKAIKKA